MGKAKVDTDLDINTENPDLSTSTVTAKKEQRENQIEVKIHEDTVLNKTISTRKPIAVTDRRYRDLHSAGVLTALDGKSQKGRRGIRDFVSFIPLKLQQKLSDGELESLAEKVNNFQQDNPSGLSIPQHALAVLQKDVQQVLEGRAQSAELITESDRSSISKTILHYVQHNDRVNAKDTSLKRVTLDVAKPELKRGKLQKKIFQDSHSAHDLTKQINHLEGLLEKIHSVESKDTQQQELEFEATFERLRKQNLSNSALLSFISRKLELAEEKARTVRVLKEWQVRAYDYEMMNRNYRNNYHLLRKASEKLEDFKNKHALVMQEHKTLFDKVFEQVSTEVDRDSNKVKKSFDLVRENLDRFFARQDVDKLVSDVKGLNYQQSLALQNRMEDYYEEPVSSLMHEEFGVFRTKAATKAANAILKLGEKKKFNKLLSSDDLKKTFGNSTTEEEIKLVRERDGIQQGASLIGLYLKSDTCALDLYHLKKYLGDQDFKEAVKKYEEQHGVDLNIRLQQKLNALKPSPTQVSVHVGEDLVVSDYDLAVSEQMLTLDLLKGKDVTEGQIASLGYNKIFLLEARKVNTTVVATGQEIQKKNWEEAQERTRASYQHLLQQRTLDSRLKEIGSVHTKVAITQNLFKEYMLLGTYQGIYGDKVDMVEMSHKGSQQEKKIQSYLAAMDADALKQIDLAQLKKQATTLGNKRGLELYKAVARIGKKCDEDVVTEVLQRYSNDSESMSLLMESYQSRYSVPLVRKIAEEASGFKKDKALALLNGNQLDYHIADLMIANDRWFLKRSEKEIVSKILQIKQAGLVAQVDRALEINVRIEDREQAERLGLDPFKYLGEEVQLKSLADFARYYLDGDECKRALHIISSDDLGFEARAQIVTQLQDTTQWYWFNDGHQAMQLLSSHAEQVLSKYEFKGSPEKIQADKQSILKEEFQRMSRDMYALYGKSLEDFIESKYRNYAEEGMLALVKGNLDKFHNCELKYAIQEEKKDFLYELALRGQLPESLKNAYGNEEKGWDAIKEDLFNDSIVLKVAVRSAKEAQVGNLEESVACREAVALWRNLRGVGTSDEQEINDIVSRRVREGTLDELEEVFNRLPLSRGNFREWVLSDLKDTSRHHKDMQLMFELATLANNGPLLNRPDLMEKELAAKAEYYGSGVEIFDAAHRYKELNKALKRLRESKTSYETDSDEFERLKTVYLQAVEDANLLIRTKEQQAEMIADGLATVVAIGTSVAFVVFTGGGSLVVMAAWVAGTSAATRLGTKWVIYGSSYSIDGDMLKDLSLSAVDGVSMYAGGRFGLSAGKHLGLARYGRHLEKVQKAAAISSDAEKGGMLIAKQIIKEGTPEGKILAKELTKTVGKQASKSTDELLEQATYNQLMRAAKEAGIKNQLQNEFMQTAITSSQNSFWRQVGVSGYVEAYSSVVEAPIMGSYYAAIDKNTWEDGFAKGLERTYESGRDMVAPTMATAQGMNLGFSLISSKLSRFSRCSKVVSGEKFSQEVNKTKLFSKKKKYSPEGVEYLQHQWNKHAKSNPHGKEGFVTEGDLKVAKNLNADTTNQQLSDLKTKYEYAVSKRDAFGKKGDADDIATKRKQNKKVKDELEKRSKNDAEYRAKNKKKSSFADDSARSKRRNRIKHYANTSVDLSIGEGRGLGSRSFDEIVQSSKLDLMERVLADRANSKGSGQEEQFTIKVRVISENGVLYCITYADYVDAGKIELSRQVISNHDDYKQERKVAERTRLANMFGLEEQYDLKFGLS